jgi:BCD family chlorophyll transporter-like MFS transporter
MIGLLVVIGLGTFGFGMADVLLEPYGGQALGLSVADTTKLTALFALGTLVGFGIASRILGQGGSPAKLALIATLVGIPGFAGIIVSSMGYGTPIFLAGVFATGLGAGLFGHATLTATMRAAPKNRIGLALGAWGAVQATAAGIGIALAGIVRDVVVGLQGETGNAATTPYVVVFMIEITFLVAAAFVIWTMVRKMNLHSDGRKTNAPQMNAKTNAVEAS